MIKELYSKFKNINKKTTNEDIIVILNEFDIILKSDNFVHYEPYIIYRIVPLFLQTLNNNTVINELVTTIGFKLVSSVFGVK